jgi:hypothetical protein
MSSSRLRGSGREESLKKLLDGQLLASYNKNMPTATDTNSMWTAPNGETFANLGSALRAAKFGDFGAAKSVTLTREGYTNAVITKGGPAGWYVSTMGDKV